MTFIDFIIYAKDRIHLLLSYIYTTEKKSSKLRRHFSNTKHYFAIALAAASRVWMVSMKPCKLYSHLCDKIYSI